MSLEVSLTSGGEEIHQPISPAVDLNTGSGRVQYDTTDLEGSTVCDWKTDLEDQLKIRPLKNNYLRLLMVLLTFLAFMKLFPGNCQENNGVEC